MERGEAGIKRGKVEMEEEVRIERGRTNTKRDRKK